MTADHEDLTATAASDGDEPALRRRTVLRAAGVVGAAGLVLTACGGGDSTTSDGGSAGGGGASSSGPGSEPPDAGGATVATSEVPVGGGTILPKEKVVVTQPTKGDFKAFTAVCTHQGCTVNAVSGGTINCPCHGSRYSVEDGSVVGGPAPRPLAEKKVTVKGDEVVVS